MSAAGGTRRDAVLGFALEASAWLALAAGFLYLYVMRFATPSSAIVPHLSLLLAGVATLCLTRMLVLSLLGRGGFARAAANALTALVVLMLVLYYALVLVGLASWGKVITWSLIRAYALQLPDLLAVMGLARGLVVAVLLAAWAGVFAAIHFAPARWRWIGALARPLSTAAAIPIAAMGAAIALLMLVKQLQEPPLDAREPFALTFFADTRVANFAHHSLAESSALDRQEDAIRAAYVPNPDARRRNVIVIVADALRADHMGVYGYERDTTPWLSARARDGGLERAERMVSACAESACGLLALAQSRYVHQITRHAFSLPLLLHEAGYSINMILGGDHTNFYGLRDAYGEVDTYFDGSMAEGKYMNDDALVVDRTEQLPDWNGLPTFIQYHLVSTHVLGVRHPESLRWTPARNYTFFARSAHPEYDVAANYYDDGVLQADTIVRRIVETLERKGYLEDALVVVTADHGEMLGEFGMFAHGEHLYAPELDIPFLLLRFGYAGAERFSPGVASQVDIAPTIARELDLAPSPSWVGGALQGTRPRRDFIHIQQGVDVGLIDLRDPGGAWKYQRNLRTGREQAHDFDRDRADRSNLIDTVDPARLSEWRVETSAAAIAVGGEFELPAKPGT